MFVYGTLMDPQVLQTLLVLPSPPLLQPATLHGFRAKMWGIYPALVPNPSNEVTGYVWEVKLEEHFERLVAYETSAYHWEECDVGLDDGETLSGCRVFVWAGEEESKDLEEGDFDFERWKRYFKGSVVKGQG
jgi:gamma-glutamylcyclotransferase (GGCT)/AIG2-like uncharacterized protein YtfP